MIKTTSILLLASILTYSCSTNEKDSRDINKDRQIQELKDSLNIINGTLNKDNSTDFKILHSTDFDFEKLDHQGEILNSKIWRDRNGENIVLFTSEYISNKNSYNRSESIFVYHYVINNGKVNLLRKFQDGEICDDPACDLSVSFLENIDLVTDLDGNNLGEITFAYQKSTATDVSPRDLKLITTENSKKFIIRGSTITDFGNGDKYGGDKEIDDSFKKGPREFLNNANKIWAKIMKEHSYIE
jgi:hypothetical protein